MSRPCPAALTWDGLFELSDDQGFWGRVIPDWASAEFAVPSACSKSSLYRTEVADAALEAVLASVARFAGGRYRPEPLDYGRPEVTGRCRPPCRQADRRIDWLAEPTSAVVAKLRAADSSPGVLDVIGGADYLLFGGYEDDQLRGEPGSLIAQRDGAVCRATVDGAVWIPQLRRRPAPDGPATCKLPATLALRGSLAGVPQTRAADQATGPAHLPGNPLPRGRRRRLPGVRSRPLVQRAHRVAHQATAAGPGRLVGQPVGGGIMAKLRSANRAQLAAIIVTSAMTTKEPASPGPTTR